MVVQFHLNYLPDFLASCFFPNPGTPWHAVGHHILEHPSTPPPEVLPVHEVQDIYTWHTLRGWFQEHRGDRCAWQSPCGSPPASCAGKWPWLLHSKHKKLRTCQVFRKISTFTLHVSYKSVCLCGDCCACWHFCLLYPAPEVAQSTLLQCKEKHWGPNEMTLPSNPGTVAPYQAVHICCAGALDQVTITHRSLRKPRAQRITSPNPCVRCGDRLLVLLANLPRGSVLSHAAGIHFADRQDHCSFVQVTVGVFHPWIPRGSRNWTSASQKTMVYKFHPGFNTIGSTSFPQNSKKTNSNSVRSIQFQNNAIHHSSINLFGVTENTWAFTTLRRPWLGLHILDYDHLHYIK